jgi:peroxiredoxin (alkyl hydroperoxide reductase subunit C)
MLRLISLIKINAINIFNMKRVFLAVVLLIVVAQIWAQKAETGKSDKAVKEERNFRIPLIGEMAPSFTAESTNGTIMFPSDYGRKWKILFSHPQDFTPVCSSEILELAHLQSEFDKLDVKVVVVSTDPLDTHIQWKKALEMIDYKGRTPSKIRFPLVEDENLSVSKLYGMIHAPTNTTRDVRGVFIIDPENMVRAIYFYPTEVGRSTEELIRTVTALQTTTREKVFTPADWKAGNDVIVPYLPKDDPAAAATPEGYYELAWFMWLKKATN